MSKTVSNSKSAALDVSDAQLKMIKVAAEREDCCLTPPTYAKVTALRKLSEKIIEMGLAREILARAELPIWRHDMESSKSFALKLTARGIKAIAVNEQDRRHVPSETQTAALDVEVAEGPIATEIAQDATVAAAESDAAAIAPAPSILSSQIAVLIAPSSPPRLGSKIAEVLGLLTREVGASIDDLMGATGWLPHTTRAALTGLRKRGYPIERSRDGNVTRYRVGPSRVDSAPANSGIQDLSNVGADERSDAAKSPLEIGGIANTEEFKTVQAG